MACKVSSASARRASSSAMRSSRLASMFTGMNALGSIGLRSDQAEPLSHLRLLGQVADQSFHVAGGKFDQGRYRDDLIFRQPAGLFINVHDFQAIMIRQFRVTDALDVLNGPQGSGGRAGHIEP